MASARNARKVAIASFLVAGFLTTVDPVAEESLSIPPVNAMKELNRHIDVIEQRLNEAEAAYYFYDPAQKTLRKAFADAKIAQEITDRFADTWANSGLASDYVEARKDVYWYHRGVLLTSYAQAQETWTRSEDLHAIARGMDGWKVYESGFRTLLSERVKLWVRAAAAEQAIVAAEGMSCGEVEACLAAKAAALEAAKAASRETETGLGANRDALAGARQHFFTAIGEPAPTPCDKLTVSFAPGKVSYKSEASIRWRLEPEKCAAKGEPSFDFVRSEGPLFLVAKGLNGGESVLITSNQAGWALVEGEVAVQGGSVKGRERIRAVAMPGDCTALKIHSYSDVTRFSNRLIPIEFEPQGCTPPDAPAVARSDRSSVLWAGATTSASFPLALKLVGRQIGTTSVSVSVGALKWQSGPIAVIDEDGDDCKTITVSYSPDPLRAGGTVKADEQSGVAPRMTFGKEPCKKPEGAPHFESLNTDVARVGPQTGVVFAVKAGTAEIAVEFGGMSTTAKLAIVGRPPCTHAEFTGIPDVLAVGETATAKIRYFNPDDGEANREVCTPPEGPQIFRADGTTILAEGPTVFKAAAVGQTSIRFEQGKIVAWHDVTVVAE